jgi:hypothetical protein
MDAEATCRYIAQLARDGADHDLIHLVPLLASDAWYDANHGDVYGGRLPVTVAETAAQALVDRSAVDLLIGASRAAHVQTREVAVRALGRCAGPEVVAALEARLDDEEPVAVAAGLALGRSLAKTPELERLVTRALDQPGAERGALAAAIDLTWEANEQLAERWFLLIDRFDLYAFQRVRDLPSLDNRVLADLQRRAAGPVGRRLQAVRLLRDWLTQRPTGGAPFAALYRSLIEDPDALVRAEAARNVPRAAQRASSDAPPRGRA